MMKTSIQAIVAFPITLTLTLAVPAQSQQPLGELYRGHENTFPTIHGMWQQDATTGQCFYYPPPPQYGRFQSPCPPSMSAPSSTVWDSYTQQQIEDFANQCYIAARTEAFKEHKRFCIIQDFTKSADSLTLNGQALMVDTMAENTPVPTQIVSFICEKNWLGHVEATDLKSLTIIEKDWATVNNCRKY